MIAAYAVIVITLIFAGVFALDARKKNQYYEGRTDGWKYRRRQYKRSHNRV